MPGYETPMFLPAGDQALVVEFGDEIDPDLNAVVHRAVGAIEEAAIDGVVETVPTYRSLLVYYDPLQVAPDDIEAAIRGLRLDEEAGSRSRRVVEVPTLYGNEFGPDLSFVAENAGLTEDEVIRIHSGADYLVYAMGFSPGFPYLGGLDPRLTTPRLESPRTLVPAGSVGIAETQTGVYPVASPGGWQIIGRTPIRMFDPRSESPSVLDAGDFVRFVPIEDADAFGAIEHQVEERTYVVKTRTAS